MDPANLPTLLGIAWLLPLASFTLIVFFGPRMGKHGLYAAYTATGTILISCILSLVSLFGVWVPNYKVYDLSAEQTERPEPADDSGPDFDDGAQRSPGPIIRGQNPDEDAQDETTPAEGKRLHFDVSEGEGHGRVEALTGNWYTLGKFGSLRVTIGYYIDSLTVLDVRDGHVHRHVHPLLRHRLHARRAARRHRSRSHALPRASPRSAGPVLPLLSVSVAVLLQHAGPRHRRQHRDGVRLLGAGRHLLLLPDRLLHRAAKRVDRGQQGVHRQPHRRLRHDHRPDGPVRPAWARSASATGPTNGNGKSSSRASSARCGRRNKPGRTSCWQTPDGMVKAVARPRSPKLPNGSDRPRSRSKPGEGADFQRRRATAARLLAVGRGRAGHLLRLRRQKRAVSAARLVARRDGRPHARQRAGPFGDDGRRGRVSGGPILSGLRARGAAGDRHRGLHHAVHRRPRSPSRPPTSSACWPIRRSASWAT
jgi:hypothetical protein